MFNYSGRLYTFGCSFTRYYYPTWADILGKEFSYHENWGKKGHGNLFIFNSVIECLARNQLTSNDTIIVIWSAISRFDYYKVDSWYTPTEKTKLPEEFICPYGNEIRDYAYFYALYELLKSKNINFKFLSWHEYNKNNATGKIYESILNKIIKIKFDKFNKNIILHNNDEKIRLESLFNRLAGAEWPTLNQILKREIDDYPLHIKEEIEKEFYYLIKTGTYKYSNYSVATELHPSPLQHMEGLKTVFPELTLSNSTINWITDINNKLENKLPGRVCFFSTKELQPDSKAIRTVRRYAL